MTLRFRVQFSYRLLQILELKPIKAAATQITQEQPSTEPNNTNEPPSHNMDPEDRRAMFRQHSLSRQSFDWDFDDAPESR